MGRGFNPWVGKIPWTRKWEPTPVFLFGEFHGQRSLAGYSPWGHKESDTTEQITLSLSKRHKNINMIHVPGEHQTVRDFIFLGSKITADGL